MSTEDFDITLRDVSLEQLKGPELEDLINALAERISYLLDKEPELLFSTLYRLDVLEHKINAVLHSGSEAPAHGLARLIVERQIEKTKTRGQWHKGWYEDEDDV
ncbi:MAG TPA: hypothetical protein VI603_05490 [Saprospiraceae bacterium]|nr:hypothetical protein [Saprospiraceae bacterium]